MRFEEVFEKKPQIHVSMDGKDYIRYLQHKESQKRKKKLTKRQKEGIFFLSLSVIGLFFVVILISDLIPKQTSVSMTQTWYKLAPTLVNSSWNDIAKIAFVLAAPVLLIIIGIAWILHGVQLRLLG